MKLKKEMESSGLRLREVSEGKVLPRENSAAVCLAHVKDEVEGPGHPSVLRTTLCQERNISVLN